MKKLTLPNFLSSDFVTDSDFVSDSSGSSTSGLGLLRFLPWFALALGIIGLLASFFCFNNARKVSTANGERQYQVGFMQRLSSQLRDSWNDGEGRDALQQPIDQFRQAHGELRGSSALPDEQARLVGNTSLAFEQWFDQLPATAFVAGDELLQPLAGEVGAPTSLDQDLGYLTEVTAALRARLAEIDSPNLQVEPAGHLYQLAVTVSKKLQLNTGDGEPVLAIRGPWLVFDQILERIEAMLGTSEITDTEAMQLISDIRSSQVALDARLSPVFSGQSTLQEIVLADAEVQVETENQFANQQIMDDLATRHNLLDDTLDALENEVASSRGNDSLWFTLGLLSGLIGTAILSLLALGLMRNLLLERSRRVETDHSQEESILLLLDEISRLAEGDLNTRATVNEGITGSIADSVNYAVTELRRLVGTMSTSAERVQVAVEETGTTARQLANASVVQSREISRSSAYTTAMANTMQQLSTRVSEANAIATRSVELSASARESVEQTEGRVQTVKRKTAEANRVMNRLGDSSSQISRSIKLMDQVAEKTRLLAMNTAIRARSSGSGSSSSLASDMAQVSEQVQGLANRLGQSASEIETLVSVVQQDVAATLDNMTAIDNEVDSVASQAEHAAKSLHQIEAVSQRLDQIVGSIDERAQRQQQVITKLSSNMNVINDVTRHSAHGLQLSASSLEDLRLMAAELKDGVAEFSLPQSDQQAINQRVQEIRDHVHVGAHSETMASRVDPDLESGSQALQSKGNTQAANRQTSAAVDTDRYDERTLAIESHLSVAINAESATAALSSQYDNDQTADNTLLVDTVRDKGKPA